MQPYKQITIACSDNEMQETVIALLADIEYDGFEQQSAAVVAYIPTELFNEQVLTDMLAPLQLPIAVADLEQKNWNEVWESNFQPITVGNFVAVRAHFHEAIPNVEHELVITPKMSFGTGHHATTYLMMQQMQNIDCKQKAVFDFGTGTGILAILAEKLGAKSVLATDNEDWTVENAQENAANNHCQVITPQLLDVVPQQKFDIILANINRHVLLAFMPALAAALNPGGTILFSGILVEDEAIMRESITQQPLQIQDIQSKNGWLCIQAAAI
ncbi:MAG: 50S ribosomal protein L11 methyltransferase [Bacteroidetes bacterium]|nr:MAG: 50S ribosomal protein L11 methyltransferase [Bacteroidota bacterium]